MIRNAIPNLLTLLNLLSGAVAGILALQENFKLAAILILAGAFFDFLDGFTARLLKTTSPIGKQLDSLADLITFGLSPALMLLAMLKQQWAGNVENLSLENWLVFTPLLLVMFSALRLARFNIDDTQTKNFVGLPTPANALFIVSLVFVLKSNPDWSSQLFVLPIIAFFSLLLIAPIPLMGLKELKGAMKVYLLILMIGSVIAVILFKFEAGVIIIPFYIILSGIKFTINKYKNNQI